MLNPTHPVLLLISTDWLNEVLWLLTNTATPFSRLLVLLAIVYALAAKQQLIKRKAFYLFCCYASVLIITLFVERNRPHHPSLRTMEVFVVAISFAIAFKNNLFTIILYAWACLVAYSRLHLGTHPLGDVLFSIIVATLIGIFWYWGLLSPRHTELHDL